MSAPPERQGVPTQPQPSRGKNTVQFALKGVPIIIPMPVNYTEVPELAGEAMEINNIKARGIAMYEKSYENGNVASIYSVLSFDVFENATVTISNFQEYKTGIKSQDTGAMNRIYDAANQTTGDPQIDLVGHPEIFIDEERAIGVYNRSSSVLEAMPISTYTATLSLLINDKIIMTTYAAMTQEPRENYPEVVKNTARKWVDAIFAAN